jgi:DeoR family transcriptional regulator, aga operon transcriptional repressor
MLTDRASDIRTYLFENGQTPVVRLAEVLGTSLATMRRDLTEMEQAGLVERLHGAARIAQAALHEVGFKARENTNLAAKRAVALAACPLIRPGSTILLDAGTTVLQLARHIRLTRLPVTVFTNGLAVAQELADVPEVTLCLLGGRLRAENLSMIGPLADAMLRGLWFDQLFLGASAISADGWITSYDAEEAQANASMVARSAQVIILADHAKFGPRATYSVIRMSGGERLITDRAPPADFMRFGDQVGLQLTLALPDDAGRQALHG